MKNSITASIALVALVFSCKTETKCRYKPEPIFAKDLPHVVQYNFEKDGNQSLESLVLDTGTLVEVGQDVCTDTRQEFRFTVRGDYRQYADSMWLREAVRQMVFLSSFSPAQAPLRAWADVLEEARADMRLGEEKTVQEGISVRVDRIVSPEESALLLVLSQK
ncbi:MAG: hypothetical protein ACKVU2_09245 [Saprospiraceae bacterium]